MKKYLLAVILIGVLMTFSACDKDNGDDKPQGTFKGGTEGVGIVFVEGSPVSSFDAGENAEFSVKLTNSGEYDVPAGEAKARIFSTSPSFGLNNNYMASSEVLYGISVEGDTPGEREIDLGIGNYAEDIVIKQEFPVNARVCYPYKTRVSTTVCMGSRRLSEGGAEQVCEVEGSRITTGTVSSAPVQVTEVEQGYKGSDGMTFSITIENKGTGTVNDHTKACEELDSSDFADIVYMDIYPDDVRCRFPEGTEGDKGKLTLYNGAKTIICERTLEAGADSNYEDNLRIILDYKYLDTTSKIVTVYEAS